MAHWFHRNPLKATTYAKWELKSVITSDLAAKICSELRLRRDTFMEHLRSASTQLDTVENEFNQYMTLLYGFIYEIVDTGNSSVNFSSSAPAPQVRNEPKNSKLRYLQKFVWTNSMLGAEAIEVSDYWFEVLNICINVALWYMKRAAWVSGKDEVLEHDAKHIHTSLRRAAGLFQFVLQNKDKLIGMYEFQGCDLESNILDAYVNQCVAEAQEVTIARAIELKHSPKIISSLAAETAHKYELCEKLIEKYNPANFEKWRSYFQLKKNFYYAYAYAYLGESLLSEDKCGEAVRACKQGITSYEKAEEICGKYAKASGPGFVAKPEKHLFFRRIQPLLNRHLEKAERENGMIYHHTVPADAPLLESKAAYGLANPEPYEFPKPADEWSTFVYNAFDISKAFVPDFGKPKKSAKPLPPVKEEKVYETDKDPTNNSGCVIS